MDLQGRENDFTYQSTKETIFPSFKSKLYTPKKGKLIISGLVNSKIKKGKGFSINWEKEMNSLDLPTYLLLEGTTDYDCINPLAIEIPKEISSYSITDAQMAQFQKDSRITLRLIIGYEKKEEHKNKVIIYRFIAESVVPLFF